MDYSASHDELTGLHNRIGVMRQISRFLADEPYGKSYVAVMSDLDHLKQINDNFGHGEGDYAIKTAASILKRAMPSGMPLGRTGGDEFTGLFEVSGNFNEESFKGKIRALCEEENANNGKRYYVDLSVGCCTFKRDPITDIILCLKQADTGLYKAKENRRATVLREEIGV